ncbi:MAG: glycosyltransferase family 4 protein [Bacteroidales bacterium]|jgi:hypothetical protein|nr:glycosyltransferase family 4 protein [Bacteroidales bacterium]
MSKLLFIRYNKPSGILEGGAQGTQKNYNILCRILGAENVTTYCINDKESSNSDYFNGFFLMFQNYFLGLTSKKMNYIVDIAFNYDYVFIDRSVFGIIAKRLVESGYKGKIITFFHNVEKLYFRARVQWWKPWRYFIVRCADKNDFFSCKYSDKIIVLNSRDNFEIEKRYHRSADELIPVALKDKYISYKNDNLTCVEPICLFLGAYFPPNNEGVLWFIKNVYPYVNIKMIIAGKGMSKLKEENNLPEEIEVYSDVPDLTPFFNSSDFMILPIFKGSGMKVKTCESLMYGKNIIATNEAFEGYELDYDKVGGLCNTAEEFIDRINYFSKNPIPQFNQYSRQIFLEKYSEDAIIDKFRRILL